MQSLVLRSMEINGGVLPRRTDNHGILSELDIRQSNFAHNSFSGKTPRLGSSTF